MRRLVYASVITMGAFQLNSHKTAPPSDAGRVSIYCWRARTYVSLVEVVQYSSGHSWHLTEEKDYLDSK